MPLAAIIGLGNPGPKYANTRHNAGCWLLDRLVHTAGASLTAEKKVLGDVAQVVIGDQPVRLFRPSTYMNESGQAVRRLLDYYKLAPADLLVMHDELDLPPGTMRLKSGGGHGGHNGLRDIIAHCSNQFMRMRIGIGHPGDRSRVTGFVLHDPGKAERQLIEAALPDAERAIDLLLREGPEKAMHFLHS